MSDWDKAILGAAATGVVVVVGGLVWLATRQERSDAQTSIFFSILRYLVESGLLWLLLLVAVLAIIIAGIVALLAFIKN